MMAATMNKTGNVVIKEPEELAGTAGAGDGMVDGIGVDVEPGVAVGRVAGEGVEVSIAVGAGIGVLWGLSGDAGDGVVAGVGGDVENWVTVEGNGAESGVAVGIKTGLFCVLVDGTGEVGGRGEGEGVTVGDGSEVWVGWGEGNP